MALIVRAFPVLPGKEAELRRFAEDVRGPERERAAAFFTGLGVVHESWHIQQTSQGSAVICVTDLARDPAPMARAYARSDRPFDRWFKTRIRDLTGIDPDVEPFGPPSETIFAWDRPADRAAAS